LAVGGEHAARFKQEIAPVLQVLDDFEGHYQIKDAVGMRQGSAGCLFELQVGERIVGAGKLDGLGSAVDADYGLRALRQFGRAVTGAAAGIQDALAAGQPRCKRVARHVFVQQIDVHLPGDEALAGELSQCASPARERARRGRFLPAR